jgi:hypothetical protein
MAQSRDSQTAPQRKRRVRRVAIYARRRQPTVQTGLRILAVASLTLDETPIA